MKAELIQTFPSGGRRSRAVSNAGQVLADTDDGAALWSAAGERLWEHPIRWPFACALAEDGTAFVGDRTSDGKPSSVIRVERDGKKRRPVRLPFDGLFSLALSPDQQTLAALSDGNTTGPHLLCAAALSDEPQVLKKGNRAGRMQRIAWSPQGTRLLTMAEKSARTPMLTIAVRDPRARRGLLWHGIADNALLLSEDRLVTWSCPVSSGTCLFALDAADPAVPVKTHALPGVRLYPEGNLMRVVGGRLAVAQNSRLYVLDGETLEIQHVAEGEAWRHGAPVLTASPDGRFFLTSSSTTTALFRWVV